MLLGLPIEFYVFGITLAVIASFHVVALPAALVGLAATISCKFLTLGPTASTRWLVHLAGEEWSGLANLFLLLAGFVVLADQFERSALPDAIAVRLPRNWVGGFLLLATIFVMSGFVDNIAAAVIGGVMAKHAFKNRVGTGYLAAIVAAANAGGAGSVVGDTTSTMLWINGIPVLGVARAFVGAIAAFLVFAPIAALQQQRIGAVPQADHEHPPVDWPRVLIVLILIATLIGVNVAGNAIVPRALQTAPLLGAGLWIAILATSRWRSPKWQVLPSASRGALFLVALVATAAMMPVDRLPSPSWQTTLTLGLLSAVFDNIPLTKLALKQGGYDWGLLAYAVGVGGSLLWFGSSAGVALSSLYPDEVRSVGRWLRLGWFVPLAYLIGFFALLLLLGWNA